MAKSVIINGGTYNDVPSVNMPLANGSGNATFYDPADATASQEDILAGKNAYIDGGKKTGSMPNNGSTSGTISTKAGTVTIPAGYTSGGTVSIEAEEQAKIIADNIKAGATILGQTGSPTVVDTAISTGAAAAGNIMSGYKAYVNGSLITGAATVPTVTQDSVSKALTIQ